MRGVKRRSMKVSIAVIAIGIVGNGKSIKVVRPELVQRARQLVQYQRTGQVSKLETHGMQLFADFNLGVTLRVLLDYRPSNIVSS